MSAIPAGELLWRRLAVFRGGFSLDAAQAVATGEAVERADVPAVLARLVHEARVIVEEQGETARFYVPEGRREEAYGRLTASGEAYAIERRHAHYYLTLAKKAVGKIAHGQTVPWLDHPDDVFANLWGALEWIVTHAEQEPQLYRSAATLSLNFWLDTLDRPSEGRRWVTALRTVPDVARSKVISADLLHDAAAFAWFAGELATAVSLFEESLALNRELGNRAGIAEMLDHLGNVLYDQGDDAGARVHYEESLAILEELGDAGEMARPLIGLARVLLRQGEDVSGLIERGAQLTRTLKNARERAWLYRQAAEIAQAQGLGAIADDCYRESLAAASS